MSCEGGLLQHSLNVYDCLAGLGTTTGDVQEFQAAGMRLDSIPQESIIIVALLHDLCKVNFYATEMRWRKDANQKWEQYPVYTVNDRNPYGHGEKSVMMASEFRVVVRGKAKTTTLGKVAKGKKMESEVELEILYIKVEINNAVVLELDKLNFVFVLNGKDMLAQIRSQC